MLGTREGDTPNLSPFSEEDRSIMVGDSLATVRLVGNLCNTADGKKLATFSAQAPVRLAEMIRGLQEKYRLDLRRDNILILVNGVEANALDDLETIIHPNDLVVLLPMFHGGI